MPYSFEWYIPGRVILEKVFGEITVDELVRFNAEVTTLIAQEGVTPVHVIVDLTNVEKYPKLSEILGTMRQKIPNKVGWMLVVTESPIMRFFASMIFQIARLKLRTFKTMPEALGFIGEMDETIAVR